MKSATYNLTQAELFRLTTAYSAIRNPAIRTEFLQTVEAWAEDQWHGFDAAKSVTDLRNRRGEA